MQSPPTLGIVWLGKHECVSWLSQGMPRFPHEKNLKWNIAEHKTQTYSIHKQCQTHVHARTQFVHSQICGQLPNHVYVFVCVPWHWCILNLSSHLRDCCCHVRISTPTSPPPTPTCFYPHWTQILGTGDITCQNLPTTWNRFSLPSLKAGSLASELFSFVSDWHEENAAGETVKETNSVGIQSADWAARGKRWKLGLVVYLRLVRRFHAHSSGRVVQISGPGSVHCRDHFCNGAGRAQCRYIYFKKYLKRIVYVVSFYNPYFKL